MILEIERSGGILGTEMGFYFEGVLNPYSLGGLLEMILEIDDSGRDPGN